MMRKMKVNSDLIIFFLENQISLNLKKKKINHLGISILIVSFSDFKFLYIVTF